MLFSRRKGTYEYLIAGLGNPTPKYENTRHNAGFLCLDRVAERSHAEISRRRFQALTGDAELGGKRCLLLKPLTFMNLSGEAVAEAARFYKITPERVLVIFDDISLEVGRLRLRRKGSDGGHNGVKSIIGCLNSEDFPRIKVGVGAKPHPDYNLADWVLSSFRAEELEALEHARDNAAAAAELIVAGQFDRAMNLYNGK